MWFRLLVIPAFTLGALAFVLAREGYSYGRLAAFIAAFVLTVDVLTFVKGRLQNALLFLASIFFCLAVLESVAQAIMPHTVFTHPKGLFGDRPELGWGPTKPGTYPAVKTVNGKQVYAAHYTIDDNLLRHVGSDPNGPTVAFFGDSFTFGDGIDDKDTLPQQFSDATHCLHVLNLAFSAYSPSQMLRELEAGLFDKALTSSHLFVLQTGPFHVERTACKPNFSLRGPRYVSVGGKVEYKGPCTSGLWRRVKEFTSETALDRVFVSPMTRRPTHDDVLTYIDILTAIANLSRDKYGAALVVLYVKAHPGLLDGTGFADDDVLAAIRKAGIHVVDTDVDAAPGDVLRIPGEGHPTGTLNRLIAHKLVEDLKAKMPETLACRPGEGNAATGPR